VEAGEPGEGGAMTTLTSQPTEDAMTPFQQSVLKEVSELQKLGVCRDLDAVERIKAMDLSAYESMSVRDCADMLLAIG
jgi:hypothetical protein